MLDDCSDAPPIGVCVDVASSDLHRVPHEKHQVWNTRDASNVERPRSLFNHAYCAQTRTMRRPVGRTQTEAGSTTREQNREKKRTRVLCMIKVDILYWARVRKNSGMRWF